MNPVLSIIVAVYNIEDYLRECIQSILDQTFGDWELILVDDGSDDGSAAICDEMAGKDPRIVVIHQANSGVGKAKNAGIEIARGRYLAFIDSDDLLDPVTFSAQIAILEARPEVDFVQYPILERYGTPDAIERRAEQPVLVQGGDEIFRSWQRGGVITGYLANKVFRQKLFESLRFPAGKVFEDRYLEADLFPVCRAAYVSTEGLYYYRYRPGSLTHVGETELVRASRVVADCHLAAAMKRVGGLEKERTLLRRQIYYQYLQLCKEGKRRVLRSEYGVSWTDLPMLQIQDIGFLIKKIFHR